MTVLDAVRVIRAAQSRDPDLTRVVASMCARAGCLDLGGLARAHPQVVIDLADTVTAMSAQLDDDPITFTVPDDEGLTLP